MNFISRKLIRGLIVFFAGLIVLCAVIFFVFPLPGYIPVLMYHFIGSSEDAEGSRNFVTLATFRRQMAFLKKMHYRVISLHEFSEIHDGKKKSTGREVVLTFDDGNSSVFDLAWPILKSHSFPSTQFLISEGVKNGTHGSIAFKDIKHLQRDPLLTWGAHTRTHPFLSQLSDPELESEIRGSKIELEKILGVPVLYFAYPFGAFDERVIQSVEKAGFDIAFTTSPKKLNNIRKNDYCLTRIKISENSGNLFIFWFKLAGFYENYKLWRHHLWQKKLI